MATEVQEKPRAKAQDRVIVIDDDEIMLLSCSEILTRAGFEVETFAGGEEGIGRIEEAPAALLFVDLKMPRIDGMEVIRRVRQIDPSMVIVVITGYATIATAVEAMKAGAYDFLPKPFTLDEFSVILNRGVERWRLARESERLRLEKEDAQRKFVTFVSHQLKTPVVAVKQYLDVLLYTSRDELTERAQEWLRRSQLRLGEMLAIIQDWLDLSKLEHGQLVRGDASADLRDVVQGVVQGQAVAAEKAGVAVEVVGPPQLPAVCGDSGSLSMLVANLVGNAVKYNRVGGKVAIRMSAVDDAVVVEVEDTGIGIPTASLDQLFQEFYRVKAASTAGIPGTGLGLAICKKIVSELGGDITVRSREGVGTTFTLRLPVHAAADPSEVRRRAVEPSEER
ncbi:MAG: hybrid sensor histidine kinase/response regulator [Acidobacteriia bacterium]|nr:hybrid sensor histidine kinase/response regulator [Terriglobia bacterium]